MNKNAEKERKLDIIRNYSDSNQIVQARGVYIAKSYSDKDKETLIIDVNGVKGRLTKSELDNYTDSRALSEFIGKHFFVSILDVQDDKVYCSRKDVQVRLRREIIHDLNNKSVDAEIIRITKHGAYLEIYGMVSGFMSNEDFSDINVAIEDVYKIGKKIKVKLKSYNEKSISLRPENKFTYKKEIYIDKLDEGEIITGKVKSMSLKECFVRVAPGVDILCSIPINAYIKEKDTVTMEIKKILYKNGEPRIRGKIIDFEKRCQSFEKVKELLNIGETLIKEGHIIKQEDERNVVRISEGLDIICNIDDMIQEEIKEKDKVEIEIFDINPQTRELKGRIINKIDIEEFALKSSVIQIDNIKQTNEYEENIECDYKTPFILRGKEIPKFKNNRGNVNKIHLVHMIDENKISDKDKEIARFIIDCKFATSNQIYRYIKENIDENVTKLNINKRLGRLVEYKILNSFVVYNNMNIYCLDIAGKYILDMEGNEKAEKWEYERVNKGYNLIGKALLCTELYLKCIEKLEYSKVEFEASPQFIMASGSKYTKDKIMQSMGKLIINSNDKIKYLIVDVFREDDSHNLFENRMDKLEYFLKSNSWKRYTSEEQPLVVIIIEKEEDLEVIDNKLSNYENISANYLLSTDFRIGHEEMNKSFIRFDSKGILKKKKYLVETGLNITLK